MKIVLIMITFIMAIQLIRPNLDNPPIDENLTLKAPKKIEKILKSSCYDCHSNETIWPAYAQLAPLSWSIASHVKDGRKALNFSKWQSIDKEIKVKRLKRAIQTVNNGMMPLSSYLLLHKDAALSDAQKMLLISWFKEQLKTLE